MAQSQSKSAGGSSSFASGLLARFDASTKAAQEARRKAVLAQAETRKREEERKEQLKKERIREEVDKIVERNVPILRSKNPRRRGAASARPKDRHKRERVASPIRKPRPQRSAPPRSGPPKPLPGMEFVVRKTEKKSIKVPHSSDYSDMFGDQYLIGVDLAVTKQMAKKTAEAAKENAEILKEKEERRKQKVKEAEDITRKENELRSKGLLTEKEKRKLKCAASAKDWVAVDAPAPVGAKLKDLVTRPLASESAPKVRTEKGAEILEAKVSEREVNVRKRQLRERILAMNGGNAAKPAPKRTGEEVDKKDESRKVRRRLSDDEEPTRKRKVGKERRQNRYSRKEENRYSRDRGYNSEEWSDYGDDGEDDDDDGDLYGIEALDREEEISSRIAMQEDKMERKRELQHKKDKERRRREFERDQGY